MPTNADLEARAVHALAAAWTDLVAPFFAPRVCILAARVAHEALTYLDVPHGVQPVQAVVANDIALAMMVGDLPMADWPDEAWNVSAGSQSNLGNGWAGHVAVIADNWYLDLSATQFDRPAKNIATGGPIVRHLDEMAFDTGYIRFPVAEGWYQWRPEDNPTYRTAPDWKVNGPEFAGPVIRRLKKVV